MAIEQAPAFQWYVKEWRSSRAVMRMSFAQRGMYLEMLNEQWENLTVPDDPAACADLLGGTVAEWTKAWPVLRRKFVDAEDEPGRILNIRLEKERDKQHGRRQKCSEKGKIGAAARWHRHGSGMAQASASHASPMPSDGFALSLAIPIAIATPDQSAIVPPELGDRARQLLEHYAEWYQQARHGARLRLIQNSLTFQDAASLCQTWDDARLEKLAKIILTTDDPFISGTDRSFKIFTMKATWADDRLRQWEQEHDPAAS